MGYLKGTGAGFVDVKARKVVSGALREEGFEAADLSKTAGADAARPTLNPNLGPA